MALTYPSRRTGLFPGLLVTIYLVAGGIVSATHHYWTELHTWKAVVSAVLATVRWPLLLLGVNLHIH